MGREYDGLHLFDTFILVFDMDTSKSSDYKDLIWAIGLNRLNLEIVGLWPKTNEIVKRRFGSDILASFAFIMIALVTGIPMVHALMRVWGHMTLMIENLRLTLILITILFELVIMRWKQTVLSSIINMIAEDWLTLKLSAERDVMIKRAWTARLIIIYSYVTTVLAFIFYIVIPYFDAPLRQITNLTDRNKPLPMQTYYVYDTDKSLQFELTFFAQAITVLVALLIYVGVNALLGLVILHMCGQLENFKHKIVNLMSGKDFNKALSSCVVTHLRLMRYANNVENTFTFILFVLVLKFGMVFCLCGFIFLTVITDENMNNANVSQISYTVVVLICLLTQTFFYCFGGELITEHCDAVYRTICDLDWYTWKSRKAKNLILLMLLTKEPFRITAGKVLPLTMTTFCSLLKTSAGYVSILLTMRN